MLEISLYLIAEVREYWKIITQTKIVQSSADIKILENIHLLDPLMNNTIKVIMKEIAKLIIDTEIWIETTRFTNCE